MNKRIFFILLSIFTFVLITLSIGYILPFKAEGEMTALETSWTVDTDDVHIEDATSEDISSIVKSLHERDEITLSCELPADRSINVPTLLLKTTYSAIEVIGNGEIIYSRWVDRYNEHKYIGSCYNFIPVPFVLDNNRIEIKLYIAEENAFSHFEAPLFGSYHDIHMGYIRKRLFPMACSCFLIVFGISFTFITLMFYSAVPNILSQLFTSILFIVLGVWMAGYYGIFQLILDATYITVFEFTALYLLVPMSLLIFGAIGRHYTNKIYRIIASALSTIILTLIVFHYINIVHMNRAVTFFHVISIITFLMIIIIMMDDLKKQELPKSAMTQELGLFLFGVSIMIHLVFHILKNKEILPANSLTNNILPLGVMMYVYLYLLNYFLYVTEMYAQRQENQSLIHLAYADGLTNLPNRSMWTKKMNELKNSDTDYCVISLDLNGLKDVNDRLGHTFGDSYIKNFAKIMEETFPKDTFMARIGGDEFVIVLENTSAVDTENYIYEMTNKISAINVTDTTYTRSVAAGYAYRSELDPKDQWDPQNVYLVADKRMYDVKRHMHNSKRIGERKELMT